MKRFVEQLESRQLRSTTTLTGTAGDNTWYVPSIAATDTVILDGKGGADRVVFGSGSNATNVLGKVVLKNENGGKFQVEINNGSGGGTRAIEIGHGLITGAMGSGGVVDYTRSPLSKLTVTVGGTGTASVYDTVAPTYFQLNGKYKTVVGDVGNLANVKSPLTISDGYGPSTAVLSGLFATSAKTVYIDGDIITGLAPAPITVKGYTTLGINTSQYDDKVYVRNHIGTLSLNTWGGTDTVKFGKNGSIGAIAGTITVQNTYGPVTRVTLDDSASTIARKVDVVDTTAYVAGLLSVKTVNADLTYVGGAGDDKFTASWTPNRALNLYGGAGRDSFDIFKSAGRVLASGQADGDFMYAARTSKHLTDLAQGATLSGGDGWDVVSFYDTAEQSGHGYWFSGTMLDTSHAKDITFDAEHIGLWCGSGSDTVDASKVYGVNFFAAGAGNDTVVGSKGSDSIYGEAGNDSLVGGGKYDQLFGGEGNDTLVGGDGAGVDTLDGGNGYDTLRYDWLDSLLNGEQYLQTAAVKGLVFNDANGNKVRDAGEIGMENMLVFADLNNDGWLQSNEPKAYTYGDGSYALGDLPAGVTSLIVSKPTGWTVTNGQTQNVSLSAGQIKTGVNFGERKI